MNRALLRWPVVASLLTACATAPRPPVDRAASEGARAATYAAWRLRPSNDFFVQRWRRQDGRYGLGALDHVAAAYPEPDAIHAAAMTRSTALSSVAGAGSGLLVFTFGHLLLTPEDARYAPATQYALVGVGGGLIITSIIAGLIWDDPMLDFADAYNAALRRDLGLPLRPARAVD